MTSRLTLPQLWEMKKNGVKIISATAYDYPSATILDNTNVHVLLVGDSLGMVVQGKENTLSVTMDEMVYHTQMVSRAAKNALVIADMPFLSYHEDEAQAIRNAGRLIKEGGAQAVKLEGGAGVSRIIAALVKADIPVQAHIGLTPQSILQMGSFRVQRDAERLLTDAHSVQEAGAMSVVLEGIPAAIAKDITARLKIPTIGIGAGPHCDGQVLVFHDLIGLTNRKPPKFAKTYANVWEIAQEAVATYVIEVQDGTFPDADHTYDPIS